MYSEYCYWYIAGGGNGTSAQLGTGVWRHVVGTFDGATLKMYVDGSFATSRQSKLEQTEHAEKFLIGYVELDAGTQHVDSPAIPHFKGMIGDVRVYNRELSALRQVSRCLFRFCSAQG